MPVAGTSCQIEVKELNGDDANVSENNRAKLMYYLKCMYTYVSYWRCFIVNPGVPVGIVFSGGFGGVVAYRAANTFWFKL